VNPRLPCHDTILLKKSKYRKPDPSVEPQVVPFSASASPYYLFSLVLGIPYVMGGLGRAGGSHTSDEYASVEGLKSFEKSIVTFLYKFAMQ